MTGRWTITAGPYEVGEPHPEGGPVEWIWVLTRHRETCAVRVVVTARAWASRCAPGTRRPVKEAIASRGATAVVEAIASFDEPPRAIRLDREVQAVLE